MTRAILFFDFVKPEQFDVVRRVAERGWLPIVNQYALANTLGAQSLPFRQWQEFEPADLVAELGDDLVRLVQGLEHALRDPEVLQAFQSRFGDFTIHCGVAFTEKLVQLLVSEITSIETFDRLNDAVGLRAVVQACDNNHIQRAIVARARQKRIPSLQLAHAIFTPPFLGRVAGEMQNLYSDFVAAYGNRARKLMVSTGIPEDRIFVTGAPIWDPLYGPDRKIDTRDARRSLGLDPARPVVTFLCSYSDGSSPIFPFGIRRCLEIHRAIGEAVRALDPIPQVLMRPHPNELGRYPVSTEEVEASRRVLLAWLTSLGHRDVQIVADRKIEAILAADVIVVEGESTALAEAMILGRPVLVLSRYEKRSIYSEADGIRYTSDSELPAVLRRLLAEPTERDAIVARQRRAVPDLNEGDDGRASERVADLIVDLAVRSAAGREIGARERRSRDSASLSPTRIGAHHSGLEVLEVVHAFPPDSMAGTELYTYNLSRALGKLGHHVTVLYPTDVAQRAPYSFTSSFYEGVEVVQFNRPKPTEGMREFSNAQFDGPFAEFLVSRSFDVVHFQHLAGLSSEWVRVAKSAGLATALKIDDMFFYCPSNHLVNRDHEHCAQGPESLDKCYGCMFGAWPAQEPMAVAEGFAHLALRRASLLDAFHAADFVHFASAFLRDDMRRHGLEHENAEVIYTGIAPFECSVRRKLSPGRVRVGYMGAIHHRKGLQNLLAAIERMVRSPRRREEPLRLEFVVHGGETIDRPLLDALESLVRVRDCVSYAGPFGPSRRGEILAEMDVLVVPSLGENYPFIIREALYAGVPVIATRIAAVPEIVVDGKNGFLVEPNDVTGLEVLLERINHDPGLLSGLDPAADPIKLIDQEAREISATFQGLVRGNTRRPPRSAEIDTWLRRGTVLIRSGDDEAAETLFRKAAKHFAPCGRLLLGLGISLYNQARYLEAFDHLCEANRLDPHDPDVVVSWAAVAAKLGRLEELIQPIEIAQLAAPDDEELRALYESLGG